MAGWRWQPAYQLSSCRNIALALSKAKSSWRRKWRRLWRWLSSALITFSQLTVKWKWW